MRQAAILIIIAFLLIAGLPSRATDLYVLGSSGENVHCGDLDTLTTYILHPADTPKPSKVWASGTAPECACLGLGATYPPLALPISTRSNECEAIFSRTFSLGYEQLGNDYYLTIVADDGAKIFMNGVEVATVDLDDPGNPRPSPARNVVIPANLFVGGENVLKMYLVNTGTGFFGPPSGKAGGGDCFYVMYTLASYPVPIDDVTWGQIKALYLDD